jgi:ankyrin repeat protein
MHTCLCDDKHGHALERSLVTSESLNISSSLQDGDTALFKAAIKGHVEALKLLLESKADVNATKHMQHVRCVGWSQCVVA